MRPRPWHGHVSTCFWARVHSLLSPPPLWLEREKLKDLETFGQSVGAGWLLRGQLSSHEGWVQADGEAGG